MSKNPLIGMSYNKALYSLASGAVDMSDFWKDYTAARRTLLKNISAINKSKFPLRASERIQRIPTAKELQRKGASITDIAHAVADISKARTSYGSVKQREQQIQKTIEATQKVFPFANQRNIGMIGDFFEWFRENQINKLFDSRDSKIQDFLEERPSRKLTDRGWARVFIKWLRENGYDDEAEMVRNIMFPSTRES